MSRLTTAITAANIVAVQHHLRDNAATLAQHTAQMSAAQALWQPTPNEWCLAQVLAHLRASADLNHFRASAILAVDQPTLPTIHPRLEWQPIVPYARMPYAQALLGYQQQRQELLWTLADLEADRWARRGTWDGRTRCTR
jgi:DinB superfamily